MPRVYFDIKNDERIFVWARPKSHRWSEYVYTNGLFDHMKEFRPVMIEGVENSQRVFIIGCATGYNPDDFEFGDLVEQNTWTVS